MQRRLQALIEEFEKLPGIGSKTAQRLAFHILNQPVERAERICAGHCGGKAENMLLQICQNLSDQEVCAICANPARDHSLICVMESPRDVLQMEKTNEFRGYTTFCTGQFHRWTTSLRMTLGLKN